MEQHAAVLSYTPEITTGAPRFVTALQRSAGKARMAALADHQETKGIHFTRVSRATWQPTPQEQGFLSAASLKKQSR